MESSGKSRQKPRSKKEETVLRLLQMEYESITQGIRNQEARSFRVLGYMSSVVSLVFVAGYHYKIDSAFLIVPLLVLVYENFEMSIRLNMINSACHVQMLEERINHMVGVEILTWERRFTPRHTYSRLLLPSPEQKSKMLNPYYSLGLTIGILEVVILVLGTIKGIEYLGNRSICIASFYGIGIVTYTGLTLYFFWIVTFKARDYSSNNMMTFIKNLLTDKKNISRSVLDPK